MKKVAVVILSLAAALAAICAIVYLLAGEEQPQAKGAATSRSPEIASVALAPPAGPPPTVPAAGSTDPLSNPASAAVRAMLEGATPDDWEAALMALVENADSNTVAALAAALASETDVHKLQLISRALNGIGTEESFRIFRDFLSDAKNLRYREHLAGTMLALENFDLSGQVLDWMMEMQRVMDYDITMACREAVGRLATRETLERIVAEHSRTNYNEYMLEQMRVPLANSECPEALDLLRGVLEHPEGRPSTALQAAAAQALARIGTQPAIDALIAALEKSPRSPADDYLAEAVLLLKGSYLQAYLQEQFDRTTSPNERYALGRALAGTVPMQMDDSEGPVPGVDGVPIPPEEEANATTLGIEADAAEGEVPAEEAVSALIPSGEALPEGPASAGVD